MKIFPKIVHGQVCWVGGLVCRDLLFNSELISLSIHMVAPTGRTPRIIFDSIVTTPRSILNQVLFLTIRGAVLV